MNPWMAQSDLILFDLDGTLYEDTGHFDYYGTQLKNKLPAERQPAFTEEYEAMKEGKHAVSVGKAYDAVRDSVLTVDPMTGAATAAQAWDGTYWPQAEVRKTYPEPLAFDFENMIAVGDGWWLPYVTARHLGVKPEEAYHSYTATKAFMVTDAFQLTQTPGLKEGLRELTQTKRLVLITNSERADVDRLLRELDLADIFDEIVDSAQKPAGIQERFRELMQRYNVPIERTLSLGDNFMNEVAPALALGMRAILIQPFAKKGQEGNLWTVGSMTDVVS